MATHRWPSGYSSVVLYARPSAHISVLTTRLGTPNMPRRQYRSCIKLPASEKNVVSTCCGTSPMAALRAASPRLLGLTNGCLGQVVEPPRAELAHMQVVVRVQVVDLDEPHVVDPGDLPLRELVGRLEQLRVPGLDDLAGARGTLR